MKIILISFFLVVLGCSKQATETLIYKPKIGTVQFNSSDQELNNAFNWAKQKALSLAKSGDPVGDWYEAALPNREAFCMRDVSHQSSGAAVLGLYSHNWNMLHKFAENISDSKDWCSYWEINRYNNPAPVDFRNDKDFWYNLPANFDVIDAAYRQYLWTGESTYLNNSNFLNFYKRSVTDYVDRWHLNPDQVLNRNRMMNLFQPAVRSNSTFYKNRGIPGYYEGSRKAMRLGIDLTAAQIAGYKAYAELMKAAGNQKEAELFEAKTAELLEFSDATWWDNAKQQYKTILYEDGSSDYSVIENNEDFSHYMLHFRAVSDSIKIESILASYLENKDKLIVELASHLADIFYKYGYSAVATDLIKKLSSIENKRRDYPENSYSVIGTIATGLMGIEPDSRNRMLTTQSRMDSNLQYASLNQVPVFTGYIDLRHEPNKTIISWTGEKSISWKVAFSGIYQTIRMNDVLFETQIEFNDLNQATSFIIQEIEPNKNYIAQCN